MRLTTADRTEIGSNAAELRVDRAGPGPRTTGPPGAEPTAPAPDTGHDAESWAWLRHAACVDEDPELFFPVGDSGPAAVQAERAKAVCHGCPVERQCLEWALTTNRTSGVWGGTDEEERRRLRRRADRRKAAAG
ncbi:hypothetical protein GCM10009654_54280 [Streptomyces hebeiensis]|uniref:Transcriptional regulator WhiB n=1 Tax=Streptomyces hebeiensis TaxID=229486 RepID=A0ABP4FNY9_9ACTN